MLLDALQRALAKGKDNDNAFTQKLEAYAAIPLPSVRTACWAYARNAPSLDRFLAGLASAPKGEDAFIIKRLETFYDDAFRHRSEGGGVQMLFVWRAGLERFGAAEFVRQQFERAAATNDEETRIMVCQYIPDAWAKEILTPFLKDTRKLQRWQDGTRMCDLAATRIKDADKSLQFDADAALGERDKQIEVLYQHCTGLRKSAR